MKVEGANKTAPGRTSLIAVDGVDGSGKSAFAERLVGALEAAGIRAALLRVDDFRQPVDWLRPGRSEADAYHDDYYDLAGLDQVARILMSGASQATVPIFDSTLERRTGERVVRMGDHGGAPGEGKVARDSSERMADADGCTCAIVVEGVFALRIAEVRAAAAVIYLQTSLREARRRILARDTARGRHPEEVLRRISQRYFPAQERYIREHDPARRADVLIDHEGLGQPGISRFDAALLPSSIDAAVRRAVADFAGPPTVK